jgi:hypothetical protein
MVRFATILFLSCLRSAAALAADAKIGDVLLHLPVPSGYCEMDPVLSSDAPVIARMHTALTNTGNRLLAVSADCRELKEWRKGKKETLNHVAEYQTVRRFENLALPDTPQNVVKSYCDGMRMLGERSMPGIGPDVQERAEHASKVVKSNELLFIGVVAEEPLVCYGASFQKVRLLSDQENPQVAIFAATILKEKVLLSYLFASYAGGKTVAELLAKQRANVSALHRLNPD